MRGLGVDAFSRLDPGSADPIGVALSGGGDSLALLHLTLERARAWSRPVLAFVVDHRLHADSAAWSRFACAAAERAGATPVPLSWIGEKPNTGVPAAARRARHALIAETARSRGCRVVLFGHTADDAAEAAAMRAEGSSVGAPVDWAPSPVWPDGRRVFVLRPLLGASREALRAYLSELGETWLEDPANVDVRFARARARLGLSDPLAPAQAGTRSAHREVGPGGASSAGGWRRERNEGGWLRLGLDAASGTLARAVLCVSGRDQPPRAEAVARLSQRSRSGGARTATLAGARLERDRDSLLITREPGRSGLPTLRVEPCRSIVWDGRYEITPDRPGVVRALAGLAPRLSHADRAAVRAVPAAARASLPVFVGEGPSGPVLATNLQGTRSLVAERFAAACGLVAHERDIVA